ncbi:hypothetical protein CYMTET_36307 [Cymbomonas tetramitiformis]|uniref:Uncharacterized protein n=1 Tax=Cymbomonas tetramitiformis TaxID=36881 RepID=A0AAE0CG67_9CHLO|nr:hypothetical protein CYMTET_36307 [Cymbomonas tetramitiformis]
MAPRHEGSGVDPKAVKAVKSSRMPSCLRPIEEPEEAPAAEFSPEQKEAEVQEAVQTALNEDSQLQEAWRDQREADSAAEVAEASLQELEEELKIAEATEAAEALAKQVELSLKKVKPEAPEGSEAPEATEQPAKEPVTPHTHRVRRRRESAQAKLSEKRAQAEEKARRAKLRREQLAAEARERTLEKIHKREAASAELEAQKRARWAQRLGQVSAKTKEVLKHHNEMEEEERLAAKQKLELKEARRLNANATGKQKVKARVRAVQAIKSIMRSASGRRSSKKAEARASKLAEAQRQEPVKVKKTKGGRMLKALKSLFPRSSRRRPRGTQDEAAASTVSPRRSSSISSVHSPRGSETLSPGLKYMRSLRDVDRVDKMEFGLASPGAEAGETSEGETSAREKHHNFILVSQFLGKLKARARQSLGSRSAEEERSRSSTVLISNVVAQHTAPRQQGASKGAVSGNVTPGSGGRSPRNPKRGSLLSTDGLFQSPVFLGELMHRLTRMASSNSPFGGSNSPRSLEDGRGAEGGMEHTPRSEPSLTNNPSPVTADAELRREGEAEVQSSSADAVIVVDASATGELATPRDADTGAAVDSDKIGAGQVLTSAAETPRRSADIVTEQPKTPDSAKNSLDVAWALEGDNSSPKLMSPPLSFREGGSAGVALFSPIYSHGKQSEVSTPDVDFSPNKLRDMTMPSSNHVVRHLQSFKFEEPKPNPAFEGLAFRLLGRRIAFSTVGDVGGGLFRFSPREGL